MHPVQRIVRVWVKDLDENPRVQLRIHTIGFWYWTANFPIVAWLFIFEPHLWLKWGLFITLIYSIYANWTSDYTGMSASQSVINTSVDVTSREGELDVEVTEQKEHHG